MESTIEDPFATQTPAVIGVIAFGLEAKLIIDQKKKGITITAPQVRIAYYPSALPSRSHAEGLKRNHERLYWHLEHIQMQTGIIQDVAYVAEKIFDTHLPPSYFHLESVVALMAGRLKKHALQSHSDLLREQEATSALKYALEYGETFLTSLAQRSSDAEMGREYLIARMYAQNSWKHLFTLNQEALERVDVARRRAQYALF